jgi:hypothetical protein
MFSLLPMDGSTVNLLEWWYRFTLDASTDYLFGESVGSLHDTNVSHVFSQSDSSLALPTHFPRSKNINPDSHLSAFFGDFIVRLDSWNQWTP